MSNEIDRTEQDHDGSGHRADTVADAEVDEAFRAVLEGLRTTLPGVQVLFAFLLTLPLQAAFEGLSAVEQGSYFLAFFGSAVASILLIAPAAHQRLRAPRSGVRRHSRAHLRFTVKMTIVGTVVFAIALAASVYLISSFVFASLAASVAMASIAALVAWAWFYVPLVRFRRM